MMRADNRLAGPPSRAGVLRAFAGIVLVSALGAGCDRPFHPFPESSKEPFWMYGYLDLNADTQWVRVMPVRQSLLTDESPIDAVVTLEKVGGGEVVEMRDSLFSFTDARLGAVTYAHNFWTTERLEPDTQYRIRAERSDGVASVATVDMPSAVEFSFLNLETSRDTAYVEIHAERVLFVDAIHAMANQAGDPAGSVVMRQRRPSATGAPGTFSLFAFGTPTIREGLTDVGRTELRVAAAQSDWPFDPTLTELEVSIPGSAPSNVANGTGYIGGVATWTVPFHRCAVLAPRPDRSQGCEIHYNVRSASIVGRVIRAGCDRPDQLADIRLVETFADGGAVRIRWKTGWDGGYRFEGIEPGADLVLQLGGGAPDLPLPRLAPGQRLDLGDLTGPRGC